MIVESPAKAKTIGGYLGPGYVVEASIGHIRDLPRNAADVPAKYKGEPWARLGVDVDNDFEPLYVVSPDRKQQVTKLKALLKDADELYLATDEDREGEAIAWHLLETLKPQGAGAPDGVPRDHPAGDRSGRRRPRARSTTSWSTRRRPAASSTASTATRSARCCGRRCCRGCRPAGCSRSRPGSSSSASGPGWRSTRADYWDIDGTFAPAQPQGRRPRDLHRDPRLASTTSGWRTGRDFDPATGQRAGRRRCTSTRPARAGLAARLDERAVRGRRASRRSRTGAGRTRRS